MDTKITVSTHEPSRNTKPFDDFHIGEFLVVPETGRLGMKLSDSAIRFFDLPADVRGYDSARICHDVRRHKRYTVPTAVDIKVTW